MQIKQDNFAKVRLLKKKQARSSEVRPLSEDIDVFKVDGAAVSAKNNPVLFVLVEDQLILERRRIPTHNTLF